MMRGKDSGDSCDTPNGRIPRWPPWGLDRALDRNEITKVHLATVGSELIVDFDLLPELGTGIGID